MKKKSEIELTTNGIENSIFDPKKVLSGIDKLIDMMKHNEKMKTLENYTVVKDGKTILDLDNNFEIMIDTITDFNGFTFYLEDEKRNLNSDDFKGQKCITISQVWYDGVTYNYLHKANAIKDAKLFEEQLNS